MNSERKPSADDWKISGCNLPFVFIEQWSSKFMVLDLLEMDDVDAKSVAFAEGVIKKPVLTVEQQQQKDEEEGFPWNVYPDEDVREMYNRIVAAYNQEIEQDTWTPDKVRHYVSRARSFIYGESIAALEAKGW